MPRRPDAELEEKIVAAAMRLLDGGGEPAITLRAVAQEAETTTPTIYERFRNREVLMKRLVDQATEDLMALLQPLASIEAFFRSYLRHSRVHPMRVGLMVETFGARYVAGDKMPAFELLQSRIETEIGIKGRKCEDLALAIASLGFGTAQGMIAAGSNTQHAAQFQRSALEALRMLLAAFSRDKEGQAAARHSRGKESRRG